MTGVDDASGLNAVQASVVGLLVASTAVGLCMLPEHWAAGCRSDLQVNVLLSLAAGFGVFNLVPEAQKCLIAANIFGRDRSKKDRPVVAEAGGVLPGSLYVCALSAFIPWALEGTHDHARMSMFLAALLSINSMLFLGFADNVLNLRWRVKLVLPTVATFPLLMVYWSQVARTHVLLPGAYAVDFGPLFYVFLCMVAVFCTNAVNILAGVNGLEVGQTLVISVALMINSFVALCRHSPDVYPPWESHLFALYLLIPLVATNIPLLYFNWYPAQIFVGDTYCYFSGMTIASAGILGQCSKTVLLFFVPQAVNFVISVPQIFRLVPCPRHRMPDYLPEPDLLTASYTDWTHLGALGMRVVRVLEVFRVVRVHRCPEKGVKVSNFTLINMALVNLGDMKEYRLTQLLLALQVLWCVVAFYIRYGLASYVYANVE